MPYAFKHITTATMDYTTLHDFGMYCSLYDIMFKIYIYIVLLF